jgi:hypothetical protein
MLTDISIEYPELPLLSQPVFSHPDWEPFASAVRAGEACGNIPEHELLRRAMPELSAALKASNEAQLHSSTQNHHELKELIQGLAARHAATAASLNALINGQIPITVQCQGTGFIRGGSSLRISCQLCQLPSSR